MARRDLLTLGHTKDEEVLPIQVWATLLQANQNTTTVVALSDGTPAVVEIEEETRWELDQQLLDTVQLRNEAIDPRGVEWDITGWEYETERNRILIVLQRVYRKGV